ncbi:MAG TPA: hypothetical protein DEQ09_09005 [Bacteroidales bacterium]|nr:hypothetical protein [Bacteroidales bacterium]
MYHRKIFAVAAIFILFSLSYCFAGDKEETTSNTRDINIQNVANKWEEIYFRSIKINNKLIYYFVSSELDPIDPFEGLGKYGGHNLFDNDPTTAWVEGVKGDGTGEYIFFKTDSYYPDTIIIDNGYQKSERLFKMNSRPRNIKLSLYAGFYLEGDDSEIVTLYRLQEVAEPHTIMLDDKMGSQSFSTPFREEKVMPLKDSLLTLFIKDFSDEIKQRREVCPTCDLTPMFSFFIKIEIYDSYKGSHWEDNCISGLSYKNIPGLNTGAEIGKTEKILDIYEGSTPEEGKIFIDTDLKKNILLVDKKQLREFKYLEDNQHLSITLMDESPDKEWVQVNITIYEEGADRVDEYSILYNVRMMERVDDKILKTRYGLFGFIKEDGKIWLDTIDGYIDLEKIREEMSPPTRARSSLRTSYER